MSVVGITGVPQFNHGSRDGRTIHAGLGPLSVVVSLVLSLSEVGNALSHKLKTFPCVLSHFNVSLTTADIL